MSIRSQRKQADELMRMAQAERAARDRHVDHSLTMIEEKIVTPAGLAACFGAGIALGLLTGGRGPADDDGGDEGDADDTGKGSGKWADIAIKVASALLVNTLVRKYPDHGEQAGEAAASTDFPDSA